MYIELLSKVKESKKILIQEDVLSQIFLHKCAFQQQYLFRIQLWMVFSEQESNVSALTNPN